MKLRMKREAFAKPESSGQRKNPSFGTAPRQTEPGFWLSRGKGTAKGMDRPPTNFFGISRRYGRGGVIRTHDPLRPRETSDFQ